MDCDASPIQFDFPVLDKPKVCKRWEHRRMGKTRYIQTKEYHHSVDIDRGKGFMNARYVVADRHSHLKHFKLIKQLKNYFNKVSRSSSNWGTLSKSRLGDRHFEYQRFRLPKNRECIGFVTRWGLKLGGDRWAEEGYASILFGYFCGRGFEYPENAVSKFLGGIRIVR